MTGKKISYSHINIIIQNAKKRRGGGKKRITMQNAKKNAKRRGKVSIIYERF